MDINAAISHSNDLKKDGQTILDEKGLRKILENYGKLSIVGSFDLDFLIKPDLDLYVAIPEYDIKKHFEVLGNIADSLRPLRIKYLDLRQANWPDFPMKEGLFIGISIEVNGQEWSVDGWALKPEVYEERVAYHINVKNKFSPEMKPTLFQIKYDIYKNKNYRSGDLYKAVLTDGVRTTDEYYQWFEKEFGRSFNA